MVLDYLTAASRPEKRVDWYTVNPPCHSAYKLFDAYFRPMHLSSEHEELERFFHGRSLPTGPQHINEYSVFLNLPGAVATQIQWLHSEVAATRKSAAVMLQEVRDWLLRQADTDQLPD